MSFMPGCSSGCPRDHQPQRSAQGSAIPSAARVANLVGTKTRRLRKLASRVKLLRDLPSRAKRGLPTPGGDETPAPSSLHSSRVKLLRDLPSRAQRGLPTPGGDEKAPGFRPGLAASPAGFEPASPT